MSPQSPWSRACRSVKSAPKSALFALLILPVMLPLTLQAETYSWVSTGNNAWTNRNSWSPQGPITTGPISTDAIVTPSGSTYGALRLNGDRAIDSLTYDSALNWTINNNNTTGSLTVMNDLTKSGSGNLIITSSTAAYDLTQVTIGGAVTVNNGVLGFGNGVATPNGPVTIVGATNVAAGATLRLNASLVTFNSGLNLLGALNGVATLAATGTSSIVVGSGGSVLPSGGNIGTLVFDGGSTTGPSLDMGAGTYNITFGTENASDLISLWNYAGVGDVVLNGLVLTTNSSVTAGTFTLFKFYSDNGLTLIDSGLTGGLSLGTGFENFEGLFTFDTNGIVLTLTPTEVIPEPSTVALFALMSMLVAARGFQRFRRTRRSAE